MLLARGGGVRLVQDAGLAPTALNGFISVLLIWKVPLVAVEAVLHLPLRCLCKYPRIGPLGLTTGPGPGMHRHTLKVSFRGPPRPPSTASPLAIDVHPESETHRNTHTGTTRHDGEVLLLPSTFRREEGEEDATLYGMYLVDTAGFGSCANSSGGLDTLPPMNRNLWGG
jgi:hypothetical protein